MGCHARTMSVKFAFTAFLMTHECMATKGIGQLKLHCQVHYEGLHWQCPTCLCVCVLANVGDNVLNNRMLPLSLYPSRCMGQWKYEDSEFQDVSEIFQSKAAFNN